MGQTDKNPKFNIESEMNTISETCSESNDKINSLRPTKESTSYRQRRRSILTMKPSRWGWMCVLGSFFAHAIVQGCFGRSSGILQNHMEIEYGQSTSTTTWVISIAVVLNMALAPVASIIVNVFSCKVSVVVGGFVFGVGLFISAFSSNLWLLYFSAGVLGGVGTALVSTPAVVILGYYFQERSGIPVGIATSGIGCGAFVFPVLAELMFETYGFTGTFLLLSGIALNLCVCGMLFRPVDKTLIELYDISKHKDNDNEKKKRTKVFNIKVLKDPVFRLFCIALMFATANRFLLFLPGIVKSRGIPKMKGAAILSIGGISETVGHVVSGVFLDLPLFRRNRILLFDILMYIASFLVFVIAYLDTFEGFAIVMGFYGVLMGSLSSQKSVVLIDILGVQNVSEGNGILTFARGIGVLMGPPLLGFMKDVYGGYTETLFLSGAFALTGSIILSIAVFLNYVKQKENIYDLEQAQKQVTVNDNCLKYTSTE